MLLQEHRLNLDGTYQLDNHFTNDYNQNQKHTERVGTFFRQLGDTKYNLRALSIDLDPSK